MLLALKCAFFMKGGLVAPIYRLDVYVLWINRANYLLLHCFDTYVIYLIQFTTIIHYNFMEDYQDNYTLNFPN